MCPLRVSTRSTPDGLRVHLEAVEDETQARVEIGRVAASRDARKLAVHVSDLIRWRSDGHARRPVSAALTDSSLASRSSRTCWYASSRASAFTLPLSSSLDPRTRSFSSWRFSFESYATQVHCVTTQIVRRVAGTASVAQAVHSGRGSRWPDAASTITLMRCRGHNLAQRRGSPQHIVQGIWRMAVVLVAHVSAKAL